MFKNTWVVSLLGLNKHRRQNLVCTKLIYHRGSGKFMGSNTWRNTGIPEMARNECLVGTDASRHIKPSLQTPQKSYTAPRGRLPRCDTSIKTSEKLQKWDLHQLHDRPRNFQETLKKGIFKPLSYSTHRYRCAGFLRGKKGNSLNVVWDNS